MGTASIKRKPNFKDNPIELCQQTTPPMCELIKNKEDLRNHVLV